MDGRRSTRRDPARRAAAAGALPSSTMILKGLETSIQPEVRGGDPEFTRRDERLVGDGNAKKLPIQVGGPEPQKSLQARKTRVKIVFLPYVRLQQRWMIRQAIEYFCGCQTEAPQLPKGVVIRHTLPPLLSEQKQDQNIPQAAVRKIFIKINQHVSSRCGWMLTSLRIAVVKGPRKWNRGSQGVSDSAQGGLLNLCAALIPGQSARNQLGNARGLYRYKIVIQQQSTPCPYN